MVDGTCACAIELRGSHGEGMKIYPIVDLIGVPLLGAAGLVLAGKPGGGGFPGKIGLGLTHNLLLQDQLGFEPGERRLARLGDRLRMVERRLEITRIEPDQQLALFDVLMIGGEDFGDKAGDMRRHRRHIAAGVGVVGHFDKPTNGPPMVGVDRDPRRDQQRQQGRRKAAQRAP